MEAREILTEAAENQAGTLFDEPFSALLEKKWAPYLEGVGQRMNAAGKWEIQGRHGFNVRRSMAMVFENTVRTMRRRRSIMQEDTRSPQAGPYTKHIFALLRRVWPKLIAHELVSVQPMSAPVGAFFFFEKKYGSSKGSTVEGTKFPLYDKFDRHYSSEYVSGEQVATGNGTDFGGAGAALNAQLTWRPVRPKGTYGGKSINVIIREVDGAGATVQEALDDGSGGFTGAVAAGAINYGTGTISGFKFTNAPANTNKVVVYYYYDSEGNLIRPQVNTDITMVEVKAIARWLKAIYSVEAQEDFRAFHGVDIDSEIVAEVGNDVNLEVDQEIINELLDAATLTTDTWSATVPSGVPEVEHFRSIITKIDKISALIHQKTLRAPANWLVVSPKVSSIIAQLMTHADLRAAFVSGGASPHGPAMMPVELGEHGQFAIYSMGTLLNKWKVFVNPFQPDSKVLIGLKGDNLYNAGAAYGPYVPLKATPQFEDPADGTVRVGLRTRYAFKVLRQEYYGTLTVNNLP